MPVRGVRQPRVVTVSTRPPIQDAPSEGAAVCSHCDTPLMGPWCHACGQRTRRGRLHTTELIRRGLAEFLELERGVLPTIGTLVWRPGRVVRDWWDGRTRPWIHPVKFFLLAFAVTQLAAWQLGALESAIEGFIEGMGGEADFTLSQGVAFLSDWFALLCGVAVALPVLLARLVGRRHTLAEHAVFGAYAAGTLALLATGLGVAGAAIELLPGELVFLVVAPIWTMRALRGAYDMPRWATPLLAAANGALVLVGVALAALVAMRVSALATG